MKPRPLLRFGIAAAVILAGVAVMSHRDGAHASAVPLYVLAVPGMPLGSSFGAAVASGDVNGDGKADIIVGAPHETVSNNQWQGRAYVFSGADASLLYTLNTPNPSLTGWFGSSVAAGDVNGDGKADIIVGASNETADGNESEGRVYVFSGADASLLYSFTTPNPQIAGGFGYAVGTGDVDGDGRGDVIVGALETVGGNVGQGRAYVFSGTDGSLLRTLTTPNTLCTNNCTFGFAVAARDVTGDGKDDIFVGSPGETVHGNTNQGRAYLFSGLDGSLLRTLTTPNEQGAAAFGSQLSMGDVNGDGTIDVIVGAPGEQVGTNFGQGRVYVFSSADGSPLRSLTTPNPQMYADFGGAVASGDVNGDGRVDILVGALGDASGGNVNQGAAFAFSGADGSLLRTLGTLNPQVYGGFGFPVAVGDVTGDGKADAIVGARDEVDGQGRVYVFSAVPSSVGGIAEQPDVSGLPASTAAPTARRWPQSVAIGLGLLPLVAAGWYVARRLHRSRNAF